MPGSLAPEVLGTAGAALRSRPAPDGTAPVTSGMSAVPATAVAAKPRPVVPGSRTAVIATQRPGAPIDPLGSSGGLAKPEGSTPSAPAPRQRLEPSGGSGESLRSESSQSSALGCAGSRLGARLKPSGGSGYSVRSEHSLRSTGGDVPKDAELVGGRGLLEEAVGRRPVKAEKELPAPSLAGAVAEVRCLRSRPSARKLGVAL